MYQQLRFILIPAGIVIVLILAACIRFERAADDSDSPEPAPTEEAAIQEPTPTLEPTLTSTPTLTPTSTPSPSPTPTPTPSPTPTPTPTPTPEPTPTPTMSQADLEGLLLSLDDLSSDWSEVDVDDHPTEVPGAENLDTTLVSAFFQGSDLGPFLVHMILLAENEADARTAFAAIEDELEEARILDDISEQVRSWETEAVEFENLGDETFAFKAVGDTGLLPVEADLVATRKGRFISFIVHAEVLVVDSERTEELARIAIERLPD